MFIVRILPTCLSLYIYYIDSILYACGHSKFVSYSTSEFSRFTIRIENLLRINLTMIACTFSFTNKLLLCSTTMS